MTLDPSIPLAVRILLALVFAVAHETGLYSVQEYLQSRRSARREVEKHA
ncbi:MAG TPA: hypothetical protein VHB68_13105 [Steroidobacteraceae bacterium]|nr:hypothetical protein [Steroidobacteraceae bacterium]